MIPRKMKLLLAVVGAAALIATPALIRTVHTRAAPADQAYGSDDKVIGAHPDQNKPSQLHRSMICGMDISASDCEKIEMMLPISMNNSNNSSKPPTKT